jgi:hypothetical protein
MQRLGKNLGRYQGETIDIDALLHDMQEAARQHGWQIYPLPVAERLSLLAFTRPSSAPRDASPPWRIYVSTGIHGDEPAGPLAVRQLLQEDLWPSQADIHLCPCLNPEGFRLNRRENEAGADLNRDYRHLRTMAVRAHVTWLQGLPSFDLCLCLHEDWESHGFYLYELNPDPKPSLAEPIVQAVRPVCPIDPSSIIEGREALGGIIRVNPDPDSRPEWPEAFYLLQNKTRLSYTLEAPSDFPLSIRVAALVTGVRAALNASSPGPEPNRF